MSIVLVQFSFAQLANTSWTGTFNIPDPSEMIVEFKTDTVNVIFKDRTFLESMKYQVNGDTLLLTKIDGESPCSFTETATYKMETKDNKLFISALKDLCPERVSAWPANGLQKM